MERMEGNGRGVGSLEKQHQSKLTPQLLVGSWLSGGDSPPSLSGLRYGRGVAHPQHTPKAGSERASSSPTGQPTNPHISCCWVPDHTIRLPLL